MMLLNHQIYHDSDDKWQFLKRDITRRTLRSKLNGMRVREKLYSAVFIVDNFIAHLVLQY